MYYLKLDNINKQGFKAIKNIKFPKILKNDFTSEGIIIYYFR